MTKKEIFIAVLLVCGIIAVSVGGYFAWNYFQDEKDTQQSLLGAQADDIAAPTSPSDQAINSAGDLSVSSNNLGQIGTLGTANASDTTTTSSPNPPESFEEYEKYKDATSALFGDVKVGTGEAIKAGSKVAIYYKGWLTDGTLFDQSRKGEDGSLQPFMFTIGAQEVIPGMEQAIFGMKTGGTRRLIIPPSVGYGEQGQKDVIPPNSVLIFEVQLVAVQ